jgi:cysteine-rich repeat protein
MEYRSVRILAFTAALCQGSACGDDSGVTVADTDTTSTTDATTSTTSSTGETTTTTTTTTDPSTTDPTAATTTDTDPTETGDPACGDGVVQAGEECDDGNQIDTDTCLSTCQSATCGDGKLQEGVEQCDDGNYSQPSPAVRPRSAAPSLLGSDRRSAGVLAPPCVTLAAPRGRATREMGCFWQRGGNQDRAHEARCPELREAVRVRRAIVCHGLPREYYVDRGPAYIAESLRTIFFLHREARKVRNDGTVRWGGGFYEVPGEYVGQWVDLRYAPQEPERPLLLYVDGARICEVRPLDQIARPDTTLAGRGDRS